jgi:uncharacterized protein (DUF1330 family)
MTLALTWPGSTRTLLGIDALEVVILDGVDERQVMINLTQLVYVHQGREEVFQTFEDAVLPLLARYRGELVLRLRTEKAAKIGGSSELPYEVHIVRFESEEDLARYTADDERQRLLRLKDESVRSTVVIKGELT